MAFIEDVKDKKVLVVGLGRSGLAASIALNRLGSKVTVQDSKEEENFDEDILTTLRSKGMELILGQDCDPSGFDLLVPSPGVPWDAPILERARQAGAEVISELELAYRIGDKCDFIAITGTNGKTTTTTLVGEIFKASGRKTAVVGNIGLPVVSEAIKREDGLQLVTEVSSFQLEGVRDFAPKISAILNLTPDHMDRHKTMEAYGEAKEKINLGQTASDFAVYNLDDPGARNLVTRTKARLVPFSRKEEVDFGVFVRDGKIIVKDDEGELEVCETSALKIPGDHNLENALAAVAICYFAGIGVDVIADSLESFRGVEHRLEFCGSVGGVNFVNDSKGTNPDAAIMAIKAMEAPIILIAGGYDKNSEFDEFIQAFDGKVTDLVLLGATAGKIRIAAEKNDFSNCILQASMQEAVKEAFRRAKPGHTVLLSPACASWDMYPNYEVRGEDFKNCVRELAVENRD